jgi:hypothetical protein
MSLRAIKTWLHFVECSLPPMRDSKAPPRMLRPFDFIDHCDRIVFERDPAFTAAIAERLFPSDTVVSRALASHQMRRWADKRHFSAASARRASSNAAVLSAPSCQVAENSGWPTRH